MALFALKRRPEARPAPLFFAPPPVRARPMSLVEDTLGVLRERVKRAQGWDRELDGRILCGIFGHRFLRCDAGGLVYQRADELSPTHVPPEEIARLTGSLDAAAALISLVLPEWALTTTVRPDYSTAELAEDPPPFRRSRLWRQGPNADGAGRAALLALIQVLDVDTQA